MLGFDSSREKRNSFYSGQLGAVQFPVEIGQRENVCISVPAARIERVLAVEREKRYVRNHNNMKTRLEILESIHDSLSEEKLRLEIAVRNLEDRGDDDCNEFSFHNGPPVKIRIKRSFFSENNDRACNLPTLPLPHFGGSGIR